MIFPADGTRLVLCLKSKSDTRLWQIRAGADNYRTNVKQGEKWNVIAGYHLVIVSTLNFKYCVRLLKKCVMYCA